MDTMDQEIIHLIHFFFCYAIGGHYVHGITQWPEVDAGAEGFAGDGGANGVDIFVPAGIELKGQDGTEGAGVFHDGEGTDGL